MSKKKESNLSVVPAEVVDTTPSEPVAVASPSVPSPPQEKMADPDRMQLELAKSKLETAKSRLETTQAQTETATLNYRYVILQLYMKYGLTQADAISETGEIHRGAALQQPVK